jgi:hypothetical protein
VISEAREQEIREALEKASPGPWTAETGQEHDDMGYAVGGAYFVSIDGPDGDLVLSGEDVQVLIPDAEFMALSRQAIPELLETVAVLRKNQQTLMGATWFMRCKNCRALYVPDSGRSVEDLKEQLFWTRPKPKGASRKDGVPPCNHLGPVERWNGRGWEEVTRRKEAAGV